MEKILKEPNENGLFVVPPAVREVICLKRKQFSITIRCVVELNILKKLIGCTYKHNCNWKLGKEVVHHSLHRNYPFSLFANKNAVY